MTTIEGNAPEDGEIEIDPEFVYDGRLYLFFHATDAEAGRRAGLLTGQFTSWDVELAGRDVRILSSRRNPYIHEYAREVAARAVRAEARSVRLVEPPLHRDETYDHWFKNWTIMDLALMAESPGSSEEWRSWSHVMGAARPRVEVTTEESRVNDQVVEALATDPGLYCRGSRLVVFHGGGGAMHGDRQPPRIVPLTAAGLRERITAWVELYRTRRLRDGRDEEYLVHPPEWCVAAVLDRGRYAGFRKLDGVVQAPTLRPDGSVLDRVGYDPETRLAYLPNGVFEPVPDDPSPEDARAAAALLLDLVDEFPFRGDADRALWLAALLTALARPAFDGPAPLFGFDSNCPGTGKTLLADLIGVIALGRRIARTACPAGVGGDEEMRKRITSLALSGERITLLDNVDEPLGGAALDAAMTATVWRDRVLGRSEMTPELPLHVVWLASGNNLRCRGDLLRRVLFARIEADVEAPERRQGFRRPDLLGYAAEHRRTLLTAGLTILRAHHLAGGPSQVPPLGSFEGWTRRVADAVAWATGINPLGVRDRIAVEDAGSNFRRSLVAGWSELPGAEAGLTVAEALKILRAPAREGAFSTLREALMEMGNGHDLPTPKVLGRQLGMLQGRVVNAMVLRGQADRKGIIRWRVEAAGDAGSAPGDAGTSTGTLKMHGSNDFRPPVGSAGSNPYAFRGGEFLWESA